MLENYKQQLNKNGVIYLRVKVYPGSSENKIKEIRQENISEKNVETLMVNIKAPAEKNKANQELFKILATAFNVPRENINLNAGASARIKLIKITK